MMGDEWVRQLLLVLHGGAAGSIAKAIGSATEG